jgi:DnaJ-class molecular chaperone
MDAFEFITKGDAKKILAVLEKAQCKSCGGSGERNDAEPGDISFGSWVCPECDGQGWNRQAVREIIAAVDPNV